MASASVVLDEGLSSQPIPVITKHYRRVPDLKSMMNTGIQNQETLSVIRGAFRTSGKDSGPAEDKPGLADEEKNELATNMRQYLGQGTRFRESRLNADPNRRNKRDKDSLSDEEMEKVKVWIRESANDKAIEDKPDTQQESRQRREFDKYNHHHFLDVWGTIGARTEKDEEWFIPDPPVVPVDDPGYLCEMCRHLNFKVLLSQRGLPGNDVPGPTQIRLHNLDRLLKRPECHFCRLIAEKITTDGIVDVNDEEALYHADFRLNVIDEGEGSALRLEVEIGSILHQWPTQRYILQKFDEDHCRGFDAYAVSQKQAKLDSLDLWLKLCEKNHDEPRLSAEAFSSLRLIDVEERRIRQVHLPCRYVCLSYVWGGISQTQNVAKVRDIIEAVNGLGHDSIRLPKTITDAMEVTQNLGIRYLWVDALCIEQDNESDRTQIISKMSSVYSGASLTIVASSNSNPLEGLPGVTTTPRPRRQIRGEVQGIELAVSLHDPRKPFADIELSRWNTRGWTYQERQLSQRAVYFTEAQMIFTCSAGSCFEDTVPCADHFHKITPINDYRGVFSNPQDLWNKVWFDPTQYHFENKAFETDDGLVTLIGEEQPKGSDVGTHEISAPVYLHDTVTQNTAYGVLEIFQENIWNIYREATQAYTRRQLTNSQDIIPAFEGLSDLIRKDANTPFWFNLPSFAFEQALLWYPQETLTRRQHAKEDGFPSWSWAGWEGPVRYRGRGWHNGLYHGPVSAVRWYQSITFEAWFEAYGAQSIEQGLDLTKVEENARAGELLTLVGVNPFKLYHLNDYEQKGWEIVTSKQRNQQAYINREHYPEPIVFPYPIPLPNEATITLPDTSGFLHFGAYATNIRFVDMPHTQHIKEPNVETHLQIGLNDEKRSANHRPNWHRIIYHQGYRAGYLVLNVPFESIDLTANSSNDDKDDNNNSDRKEPKYRLIAISRDETPRIAPPHEGWDIYHAITPVDLQRHIGFGQYYQLEPDEFRDQVVKPPHAYEDGDKDGEPNVRPENEDGSPHWDRLRFQDDVYPLYNVLLVEQHDDGTGRSGKYVTRLGIGKVHLHAFHHAGAEWVKHVQLR